MRIDVVHFSELDSGIRNGIQHDPMGAVAVIGGQCDVVSVSAHPVSHQFGDDVSAAFLRQSQLLQNQHSGAFTDHESVTVLVKRP